LDARGLSSTDCNCPHHPDRGFAGEVESLKLVCNCRKPNTGLVERAAAELNIDLAQSWLVGDSTADIALARRCGLRSILVGTGLAGQDGRYSIQPDFTADGIAGAVKLILEQRPQSAGLEGKSCWSVA
jgi:histidinol phosphatase-like enzyme